MPNRTGQKLDKYRLTLLLGQGAFAEVYLAEKVVGTGSPLVAIKILNMKPTNDGLRNFLSEARNFSLVHPNILRIRGFGIEGETPFIVMDYAQNGTLRQRHPRGSQVPISVVIGYVDQIAGALQYIHDEGLIHRDVKPDNILVGRTPLTGGRTSSLLTRTPAWAFGRCRVGQRPRALASASFGRDPGWRRDSIAH